MARRVYAIRQSAPNRFVVADVLGSLAPDRASLVDDTRLFFPLLLFFRLKTGLEGIDAFAKVAHDFRQLSATAEEDDHDEKDDQKMPNA
jgi:hypothetical protein